MNKDIYNLTVTQYFLLILGAFVVTDLLAKPIARRVEKFTS